MPAYLRFITARWFQILCGGVLLFIGAAQGLKFTGNLNLIPTVIIVGALVVPVSFVSYFLSSERHVDRHLHGELSLPLLTVAFFVGGAIGVVAAGVVEYSTLSRLSIGTVFGVALTEETAKLILPAIIYSAAKKYRSQADGLLFGVATGMGFAALETMGYSMVAFIRSQGDVTALQEALMLRGLLSPVGHAAWTGLVCSVWWGARQGDGNPLSGAVFISFIAAVVLHALWNFAGTAGNAAIIYAGYFAVGAVSLALLIIQLRMTRKAMLPAVPG